MSARQAVAKPALDALDLRSADGAPRGKLPRTSEVRNVPNPYRRIDLYGPDPAGPLRDLSKTPVGVCHRMRSRKVKRFQFGNFESGCANKFVHFTVQVTSACNPFPYRREPVLPSNHAGIGSTAVSDEKEPSAGLEDTPHLLKRHIRVCDGAQRPGHHDDVDTGVGERQLLLCGLRQKFDIRTTGRPLARHLLQFERKIDTVDMPYLR